MILKLLFIIFALTFSWPSQQLNFTLSGNDVVNNTSITVTHYVVNHTSITVTQHFNNRISNPLSSKFGRVFYRQPIQFLDSSFNSTVSFFTRFSFTITLPSPSSLAGEGIAFLIISDLNSLPDSGGSIGLPTSHDQNSHNSSFLAVEFDTNFDQNLGDINDNHLGIDLDSIVSVASVDLTPNGINLKSGKKITAWIEYRNPEKVMKVWVGYTQTKPEHPILVLPIDLSEKLNGFMHLGFSAANGRGSAAHIIDSWYFRMSESVSPVVEDEAVGPDNCLICFPKDPVRNRFQVFWFYFLCLILILFFFLTED